MHKADDALKTIGEVTAETGIAAHILRYWERNVAALKPLRRAGGRRYYRPADIAMVRQLHRLVTEQGYTLEGAARAVSTGGSAQQLSIAAPAAPAPDDRGGGISLARLTLLRNRLQAALDR
jgi:DNA-binding transcriptional MerR regulator